MSETLRYVILRHEGVLEPHFDLMFELGEDEPLVTWRSSIWPLAHETQLAPLPHHRRAYLTYEGPLASDRGSVRRIAEGTFRWESQGPESFVLNLLSPTAGKWLIREAPLLGAIALRHGDSGAT